MDKSKLVKKVLIDKNGHKTTRLVIANKVENNNPNLLLDEEKIKLESKRLNNLWSEELKKNGVGDKSKILQRALIEYNKTNFPVKIQLEQGTDYLTKQPYKIGEINFSDISGWFDSKVFHTVNENHRLMPNKIGKKINLRHSHGGGSAYLDFDYTPQNIKIVERELAKHGYKTKIDNSIQKCMVVATGTAGVNSPAGSLDTRKTESFGGYKKKLKKALKTLTVLYPEDKKLLKENLKIGAKVEAEHHTDMKTRIKTAKEHLKEQKDYYTAPKPKDWAKKEIDMENNKIAKSKRYEYIDVHRGGKTFKQKRLVGSDKEDLNKKNNLKKSFSSYDFSGITKDFKGSDIKAMIIAKSEKLDTLKENVKERLESMQEKLKELGIETNEFNRVQWEIMEKLTNENEKKFASINNDCSYFYDSVKQEKQSIKKLYPMFDDNKLYKLNINQIESLNELPEIDLSKYVQPERS